MNDHQALKAFKKTTDNVLETTLAGTISQKGKSFTALINMVGRETFGTEEVKVKHQGVPSTNRREVPECKTGSEVNQEAVDGMC